MKIDLRHKFKRGDWVRTHHHEHGTVLCRITMLLGETHVIARFWGGTSWRSVDAYYLNFDPALPTEEELATWMLHELEV